MIDQLETLVCSSLERTLRAEGELGNVTSRTGWYDVDWYDKFTTGYKGKIQQSIELQVQPVSAGANLLAHCLVRRPPVYLLVLSAAVVGSTAARALPRVLRARAADRAVREGAVAVFVYTDRAGLGSTFWYHLRINGR
jgi:hypothetical protein